MAQWLFNKGEWTEAFVFLRLLGEGRLYGADANFQKDEMTYIDIVNIIRDDVDRYLVFERFMNDQVASVSAKDQDNIQFKVITAPELSEKADFLYKKIKEASNSRSFEVPEIEDYLMSLRLTSPKAHISEHASELYGDKTDIIITSQDSLDNTKKTEGFSIKSHLGSSSTLFNSSTTSGFEYIIEGCDDEGMLRLNSLASFKDFISEIKEKYNLKFKGSRNDAFDQNIRIVDSQMDKILNCAILSTVGYITKPSSTRTEDICKAVVARNPIGVRNPEVFYPSKFKDFLFDSFAGLTASSPWNGRKLLTGGYIDVDKNGNMLYYRAMSDDIFSSYLYYHTYWDRPDRGYLYEKNKFESLALLENRELTDEELSKIARAKAKGKKGDWGYIQKDEQTGEYTFAINFQVRFK